MGHAQGLRLLYAVVAWYVAIGVLGAAVMIFGAAMERKNASNENPTGDDTDDHRDG